MEGLVSRSGSVKKFEFLRPFSKATEKTEKSCFALDQLYIELKMKRLFTTTSNVLPVKIKCRQLLAGSGHQSLHRLLNL
jgi:hypothetical protein